MNANPYAPTKEAGSMAVRLLLASPIIWSIYHVVGYFLVEAACTTRFLDGRILGVPAVAFIVIVLTVLSLAGIAWAGFLSFRHSRRERENETPAEGRERFLGTVGATFSIILALIVLADGASILVLGACG